MIAADIKELENIVDNEINGYKNIEKLYVDKKEILIQGKANELYDVDSQIENTYKTIHNFSEARKNMSKRLNMPTYSMTDIINNLRETDVETAKKFEQKKETVNKLAHKIFELEKTNLELLKHGSHITNKTLEIILRGIKPTTKEYNQKGQNITQDSLEISSIVEEA